MSNDTDHAARVAEIEARIEAATPGPWQACIKVHERPINHLDTPCVTDAIGLMVIADAWGAEHRAGNAELIANAPADLRYLLARVRELEAKAQQVADEANAERCRILDDKEAATRNFNDVLSRMSDDCNALRCRAEKAEAEVVRLTDEIEAWQCASGLVGVGKDGHETDPSGVTPGDLEEWERRVTCMEADWQEAQALLLRAPLDPACRATDGTLACGVQNLVAQIASAEAERYAAIARAEQAETAIAAALARAEKAEAERDDVTDSAINLSNEQQSMQKAIDQYEAQLKSTEHDLRVARADRDVALAEVARLGLWSGGVTVAGCAEKGTGHHATWVCRATLNTGSPSVSCSRRRGRAMNSTDLAHALGVPMDTPGCWDDSRRGTISPCLWPMPDSGLPGAELWTYWLMRALGWPRIIEQSGRNGYWVQDFPTKALTPVAALYAAYKETKS